MLLDKDGWLWVGNTIAALAVVALFGFAGLVGYATGVIVNRFVPRWLGWED